MRGWGPPLDLGVRGVLQPNVPKGLVPAQCVRRGGPGLHTMLQARMHARIAHVCGGER